MSDQKYVNEVVAADGNDRAVATATAVARAPPFLIIFIDASSAPDAGGIYSLPLRRG
jgi:hypothetical protein